MSQVLRPRSEAKPRWSLTTSATNPRQVRERCSHIRTTAIDKRPCVLRKDGKILTVAEFDARLVLPFGWHSLTNGTGVVPALQTLRMLFFTRRFWGEEWIVRLLR